MAKTEFKTVAKLTVHGASEMTEKGRAKISDWLRKLAWQVFDEGGGYSKVFTARYRVPVKKGEK